MFTPKLACFVMVHRSWLTGHDTVIREQALSCHEHDPPSNVNKATLFRLSFTLVRIQVRIRSFHYFEQLHTY